MTLGSVLSAGSGNIPVLDERMFVFLGVITVLSVRANERVDEFHFLKARAKTLDLMTLTVCMKGYGNDDEVVQFNLTSLWRRIAPTAGWYQSGCY